MDDLEDAIEVKGTVEAETENAWLIAVDPSEPDLGGKEVWFPKAVCALTEDGIEVPQWLYDKKIDEA